MTKLSQHERATIDAMFADGQPVGDIAAALGRPAATVLGYLTYSGQRAKTRTVRAITAAEHATIADMLADGESFEAIGRALGRAGTTISRYAYRVGLASPGQTAAWASATTRRRAVEWYDRGVPVAVIVARSGVREGTLYNDLRRAGVPLRRPAIGQGMRRARIAHQEAPAP